MRTVAPPCPPPGTAPAPRASWVGPGRLQNPRRPQPVPAAAALRAPDRPPPPPAADPPDSEAPGRGRGGRPSGAPPALSRPRGQPPPEAGEGAAEEQPEAPEAETSRSRRHCGEEGEEEREEGRAGWEKRKKSFETFPLPLGAGDAGTAGRSAAPRGGRTWGLQTAPLTAADAGSVPAPYTAFPGHPHSGPAPGAANPASREDFTPDLGRTPCTPVSRAPRIPGPSLLWESDLSQTCHRSPIQDHPPFGTRSRPSRFPPPHPRTVGY
jgi:hypothetical protein